VILDEADRLLSMGFQEEILELLSKLPLSRQTLLFTATWPQKVDSFALRVTRSPVKIMITQHKSRKFPEPARTIDHVISVTTEVARAQLFLEILSQVSQ